jgi:FixJ family two-component response regulator
MVDANSTVLVVDDDPALRKSLGLLLESVGLHARLFASIDDFLKSDPVDGPSCLVLDVRLPGKSGLDLQRELAAANRELDAIQLGLARDRARRENENVLADLRERFASLSPREREIMIQVARGRLGKQIANDIGIAESTVKVHRSRAMQKMNAGSLPELGRMADRLRLVPDKPQRS